MEDKKCWFFGSKLNSVLLLILIVLMVIALRFMFQNKEIYFPTENNTTETESIDTTLPPLSDKEGILGDKDSLVSFSIRPMSKVKGILSYRGELKGGYFFEANVLINILDSNKKVLKQSNAMATTDWMTVEGVAFEGNIDFTGLPKGNAYFEIKQDDPSGGESGKPIKSIQIPIIIE